MSEAPPDQGARTRGELARFLMQTGPWVAQLQRQVLGQLDPPLGAAQYTVLTQTGRCGQATMAELRARSLVTFSTLSETVSSLVRLGFLERRPGRHDRRSVELRLTDCGRRILTDAEAAMARLAASLLEGVRSPSETEVAELLGPLADRIRTVLTDRR